MTRLASLGSGSRGNGTLVDIAGELFLVDCGFTLKQTEARLARLDVKAADISAVLVTHEHSDHLSGVAALAHKYALPVYATHGTLNSRAAARGSLVGRVIDANSPINFGAVTVMPIVVPHDAREPVQFVFESETTKVGVISDLGHVTPHVIEHYQSLDLLMMESNYDREMLIRGRYPESVKRRINGNHGHLSNEQAAGFLSDVQHPDLKVVVGHVSEENNHPDLLNETFDGYRSGLNSLEFASQSDGVHWLLADEDLPRASSVSQAVGS